MKADTRIAYHARSRNASFEGALETTAADPSQLRPQHG